MANKNVIIAYLQSTEVATAADALKAWDKANDDIKLGGIGILTHENGEIKIHNVGAVATGTGAKAGVTIGIIAGILTGGAALLVDALAGLAGGALLGSLKHKNLGLTDDDIDTMKRELSDGKAALVVTADDDEVQPTVAEIERLGGRVARYTMDREAEEAIERAAFEADRERWQADSNVAGLSH